MKTSQQKTSHGSSHVLGQISPDKEIFAFMELAHCLLALRITYLWNARVLSFSQTLRAQSLHQITDLGTSDCYC